MSKADKLLGLTRPARERNAQALAEQRMAELLAALKASIAARKGKTP